MAQMAHPLILAFDTSGPWCATALLQGGRVLAQRREELAKGQAERLMPLITATLADAGLPLDRLDAIAVGIGPGNFTGIRISVAAARGLALALGVPAIGVSNFEAMRGPGSRRATGAELVSLPAPRGGLYLQHFEMGHESRPPDHLPDGQAPDWTALLGIDRHVHILGARADLLSALLAGPAGVESRPPARPASLPETDLAATLARIAADKLADKLADGACWPRPAPLYVKPADAAPQRHAAPTIL